MNTGHTSWQAPHVVHDHSVSSAIRPPVILGMSASAWVAAASAWRAATRSGDGWAGSSPCSLA
jgi:hypothetical protein